jgi:membrane protein YqaA with SNARE-associated domain
VTRFLNWVQGFAETLGGPGLFLLSFLDSSFLSFPEVTDILIVVLVVKHPERFLWYSIMPTLGSILGSYILFALARRGGEAFLRRRMSPANVERAFATVRRYGVLAVAVPSIMPPPVPFKIFVLAAGAARVRPMEFLLAVSLGRGVRYIGEAVLALWYGQAALDFMQVHGKTVSLWLAVIIAVLSGAWIWWSRRRGLVDSEASKPV